MPLFCWNCGAEQRWTCRKCGSQERRPNGKGCAACHRERETRRNRARGIKPRNRRKPTPPPDPASEGFTVTPAMRAYLAAFDAWLKDRSDRNRRQRAAALERLENDRSAR